LVLVKHKKAIKENNKALQTGIIQFYLKNRGFGYIRVSETGEEFHFAKKNLLEEVEDKDVVTFELKKTKHGFYADLISKMGHDRNAD